MFTLFKPPHFYYKIFVHEEKNKFQLFLRGFRHWWEKKISNNNDNNDNNNNNNNNNNNINKSKKNGNINMRV